MPFIVDIWSLNYKFVFLKKASFPSLSLSPTSTAMQSILDAYKHCLWQSTMFFTIFFLIILFFFLIVLLFSPLSLSLFLSDYCNLTINLNSPTRFLKSCNLCPFHTHTLSSSCPSLSIHINFLSSPLMTKIV
jgi:hypothetical protein